MLPCNLADENVVQLKFKASLVFETVTQKGLKQTDCSYFMVSNSNSETGSNDVSVALIGREASKTILFHVFSTSFSVNVN